MEFKLILYIVGGILYFFYTVGKKTEEKRKNAQNAVPKTEPSPQPAAKPVPPTGTKPVSPPGRSPMETVVREMKRQQTVKATEKKEAAQTLLTKEAEKRKAKELFIHEKKQATFGSGAGDAPVFEPTKDEENIFEKDNRISHESAYHLPAIAGIGLEEEAQYEFDARAAFIGSIIFERKY